MSASIVFVLLVLSITSNDAAKILAYFPYPSISHSVAFRPLTQELAKRGHVVTVITPDPAFPNGETPPNLTEIDVHDLSYEKMKAVYKIIASGDNDVVLQEQAIFHMLVEVIELQLKVDKVQKLLREEKFDLLLLEGFTRPALFVSHVIKAPVIQVSSFGCMNFDVETIGASWHPILYPHSIAKRLYDTTNWEKLSEIWNVYRMEKVMQEVEVAENEMGKRLFGPNVPTMNELRNRVEMLFLNTHPIWDGNRPVPPSVVYMGGLHQKPVKELPTELKTYLDTSKNGVIYISFGTNVQPSLLPQERIQMMAKVFSELPYDVLWKFDRDDIPGRAKNIRISRWLPQSDLLRHPNVKVFITQGGLQSTDEAITAGMPLIGVPMLGDQWYNVEKYVHHKFGLKLDFNSMTAEEFKNTINRVIGDPSYRQNIVKFRNLIRDQPMHPLERAVWWTEHVMRHGGARHLRTPAANMSWADYLELELVLTVTAIVFTFVLVLSFVVYKFWTQFSMNYMHKKLKDN